MINENELMKFLQEEHTKTRVRAEQWSAARAASRMISNMRVTNPMEQRMLTEFFCPVREQFLRQESVHTERRPAEEAWILPQQEEIHRTTIAKEELILRSRFHAQHLHFYEEHVGAWFRLWMDISLQVISDEAEERQQISDDQVLSFTVISLGKRMLNLEHREAEYRVTTIEVLWQSGVDYLYTSFKEESQKYQPDFLLMEEWKARRVIVENEEHDFTALVYYESCKVDLESEESEYRSTMIEVLWLSGFEFIVSEFEKGKANIAQARPKST